MFIIPHTLQLSPCAMDQASQTLWKMGGHPTPTPGRTRQSPGVAVVEGISDMNPVGEAATRSSENKAGQRRGTLQPYLPSAPLTHCLLTVLE